LLRIERIRQRHNHRQSGATPTPARVDNFREAWRKHQTLAAMGPSPNFREARRKHLTLAAMETVVCGEVRLLISNRISNCGNYWSLILVTKVPIVELHGEMYELS
jgi:hypothetical protein